jgi:hypothetical protein
MNRIKSFLLKNIINVRGFRSRKKILVIESDDWGTVRMRSKEAYDALLKKGYPVNQCGYNRNDSLESNSDLEGLRDMLLSVVNIHGQHPVMTMNVIMTNPDFIKIEKNNFSEYYSEIFTDTLNRYKNSEKVLDLYKEGLNLGIFRPQLHGIEHVNVKRWMKSLQNGDKGIHEAFSWGMFSAHTEINPQYLMEYMDALAPESPEDNQRLKKGIVEAATLFTKVFGYQSKTFIAPCFIWDSSLQPTLSMVGVKGIQGMYYQNQPTYAEPKYRTIYHYVGQYLGNDQIYIMRNVGFEPALVKTKDWVTSALKEIDIAFTWHKPAIISSHRVNFVGNIHPENREYGLGQLKLLLESVIQKYPDVEFMSSDQLLIEIIKNNK